MMHPDESMLLAYIRQQLCADRQEEIQQHIACCQRCATRCAEYMRVGETLEAWVHSRTYRSYPSLTESVFQKIHSSKPSSLRRLHTDLAPPSWRIVSLPTVVALVTVCMMVLIALASHVTGMHRGEIMTKPTQVPARTYQPQITSQPGSIVPPVYKPTQKSSAGSTTTRGPTARTTGPSPYITNCTMPDEQKQWRLHICGFNFTPGSYASLFTTGENRLPKQRKPVLVDAQGMIQDTFTIDGCKDVPLTIFAENTTDPSETSQVLEGIQFKNCSVQQRVSLPPQVDL